MRRSTVHGGATRGRGKSAYDSWAAMVRRCTDPSYSKFGYYGGRSPKPVTVAPRWMDYSAFFADMGPRPSGTTLDRIDPHGNYEPGNCRWATWDVQSRNKRRLTAAGSD